MLQSLNSNFVYLLNELDYHLLDGLNVAVFVAWLAFVFIREDKGAVNQLFLKKEAKGSQLLLLFQVFLSNAVHESDSACVYHLI